MWGRKERRRRPPATSSDFETLKLESFFKCSPRHKHVVGGLKMHHVNFGPRIYFVPTSATYVNYRRQTLTTMTSIKLILTILKIVMTFIFVNQGQNSCEVKIRKKSLNALTGISSPIRGGNPPRKCKFGPKIMRRRHEET